jgi:hypothetical protein
MDSNTFSSLRLPIKMLKVSGLWQTKDSTWAYFCYGVFMHLFVVDLFMILQFLYLFSFETLEDFANLMTMLPTYLMCVVKTINLFHKMPKIYELFDVIDQTYRTGLAERTTFSHVKNVYKIFIAFWSSAVLSCLVGGIAPFKSRELPYR